MGGELPKDLILRLKKFGSVETFVETGTYRGDTAIWASEEFSKVITIERAAQLYNQLLSSYEKLYPNIVFLYGDSGKLLGEISWLMDHPTIFWLDAHYSGGDTVGADYECPLLKELECIVDYSCEHYILIDDAHMFLNTPPSPHNPSQWPSFTEIQAILDRRDYTITVLKDVIVAVPEATLGEVH